MQQIDMLLDPRDPDVIYAATHQRMRSVAALLTEDEIQALVSKREDLAAEHARELLRKLAGEVGEALVEAILGAVTIPCQLGGGIRDMATIEGWLARGIARVILKDAPVLVLDDCLSAVDTATESRILTALRAITARRTTVVAVQQAIAADG